MKQTIKLYVNVIPCIIFSTDSINNTLHCDEGRADKLPNLSALTHDSEKKVCFCREVLVLFNRIDKTKQTNTHTKKDQNKTRNCFSKKKKSTCVWYILVHLYSSWMENCSADCWYHHYQWNLFWLFKNHFQFLEKPWEGGTQILALYTCATREKGKKLFFS